MFSPEEIKIMQDPTYAGNLRTGRKHKVPPPIPIPVTSTPEQEKRYQNFLERREKEKKEANERYIKKILERAIQQNTNNIPPEFANLSAASFNTSRKTSNATSNPGSPKGGKRKTRKFRRSLRRRRYTKKH